MYTFKQATGFLEKSTNEDSKDLLKKLKESKGVKHDPLFSLLRILVGNSPGP